METTEIEPLAGQDGLEMIALTEEDLADIYNFCKKIESTLKNKNRRRILALLSQKGPMTVRDVGLVANDRLASVHLARLLSACLVLRETERPFRYDVDGFLQELCGLNRTFKSLTGKKNSHIGGIFKQKTGRRC